MFGGGCGAVPSVAHETKTDLEAAVCAEMDAQGLAHEHRTLHYRIRMKSGKDAKYEPAIVIRRGAILFLVEPCMTVGRTAPRLTRFLATHSPEIVLALVAPSAVASKLPPECYDELYEDGEVPALVRRIREQDPQGAVRPFTKRRPTRQTR